MFNKDHANKTSKNWQGQGNNQTKDRKQKINLKTRWAIEKCNDGNKERMSRTTVAENTQEHKILINADGEETKVREKERYSAE